MGGLRARQYSLCALLSTALVGCQAERTELMLRVATNIPQGPAGALDAIRVRVTSLGEPAARFDRVVPLGRAGSLRLPVDLLGITPRDEDPSRAVVVDLDALGPGGAVMFSVRAQSGFVLHETRVLSIFLADRCRTSAPCPAATTCGASECVAVARTPASLPPYEGPIGPDASIDAPDAPRVSPGDAANDLAGDESRDVIAPADARDAADVLPLDARPVTDAPDAPDAPRDAPAADVPPAMCPPGTIRSGTECVVDGPPRPIAPLSGSTLTSTQVLLRVESLHPETSVKIDLCGDPLCARTPRVVELAPGVTSTRVTLSPGVVYWRTRRSDATETSPVWRMTVRGAPSLSAAALAWGTSLDMTLQGTGVVATFGAGTTATPESGAGGMIEVAFSLPGVRNESLPTVPLRDRFGALVVRAGDTNGDGLGEFAVAAPGLAPRGAVYLYRTALDAGTGLRALLAPQILRPTDRATDTAVAFGVGAAALGDLNADGYADFAVLGYDAAHGGPVVFVYHGSRSGLVASSSVQFASPRSAYGRPVIEGLGDLDGDGYSDFAISDPAIHGGSGEVRIFRGSAGGVVPAPTVLSPLPPEIASSYRFGEALASAGDLNGDGQMDLAVGAPGALDGVGRVYVVLGPVLRPTAGVIALEPPSALGAAEFGASLAALGDANADGFTDLAIGAPGAAMNVGRVLVFHGASSGLLLTPTATLAPARAGSIGYGASVSSLNETDLAASGSYDDISVSGTNLGAVDIYHGSATGIELAPTSSVTRLSSSRPIVRHEGPVAAGDLNNDGHSDVVVAAPAEGCVYVYMGRSIGGVGGSARPSMTLGENLVQVSSLDVGDLNNDGFADVVVGAVDPTTRFGRVLVFQGSARGPSQTAVVIAPPDATRSGFGTSVSVRGDLNGDRIVDLAVGAPFANSNDGKVYLYPGRPLLTPMMTPATTVIAASGSLLEFGQSVAVGDVSGDSLADLLVAGPRTMDSSRQPRVQIYRGPIGASTVTTSHGAINFPNGSRVCSSIAVTGNTDGTPGGGVLVAGPATSTAGAMFFHGGAVASTAVASSAGTALMGTMFAAADLNADSFTDLVLGDASGMSNTVTVQLGSLRGLAAPVSLPMNSALPGATAGFGQWMAPAGDFNRDGVQDVVVVSSTNGSPRAWVVLGRSPFADLSLVQLLDYGSAMLPTLAARSPRGRTTRGWM